MLTQSAAQENSTVAVTPPVRPALPWRVAHVQALPHFRLRVQFLDGLVGEVEMANLVHSERAGVFGALSESGAFEQARVELGAVVWPCGLDLAPDAMYRAIKEKGLCVL